MTVLSQFAHKSPKLSGSHQTEPVPVDFKTIGNWACFDADTGKDSAREIREYFIPDFSNWKDHDSFEQAFTRLLRDLKADDTQPST